MNTSMKAALLLTLLSVQSAAVAQRVRSDELRVQAQGQQAAAQQEAEILEDQARRTAQERQLLAQQAEQARSDVARAEVRMLEADSVQLEEARRNLEVARAELERNAQEIARLSAQRYGDVNRYVLLDREYNRMRRPLLGLNIGNDDDGVRVVGVSPGGPGATAGVEIGDLIVAIDGLDVSGSAEGNATRVFLDQLAEVDAGSEVALSVLRDAEPLSLTVQTSDRDFPVWIGDFAEGANYTLRGPDVRIAPVTPGRALSAFPRAGFIGGVWSDMQLVELTPALGEYFGADEGLLVVRAPGGEDFDLRDGDVILEIGDRTPQSVGHAMRILASFEPGETLEVTIMREQRRRTVELDASPQ